MQKDFVVMKFTNKNNLVEIVYLFIKIKKIDQKNVEEVSDGKWETG
jgi:hypothetical protein